ncbi:spore surface glycoprotein BclB, partial [Candidatus Binatia bacterium]|nr:spore surface glycoprotein BclB [Candidatus Binatia bacterium]
GADGATGATGADGATGPTGAAGAGTIFASSSGDATVATTSLGGLANTVAVLPLSGSSAKSGITVNSGTIDLTGITTGQPVARDGVITSITGFASIAVPTLLVGSTVTETISLWQSTTPDNVYTPIPGASVTLAPPLTGVLSIGAISSGSTTGLTIPVTAGTNLIVVYAADTTSGIDVASVITANVGAGVVIE